jgi:hypothetical protein
LDLDKCEELGVKGHFIWYESKLLNKTMWKCMGDIDKAQTNCQKQYVRRVSEGKGQGTHSFRDQL